MAIDLTDNIKVNAPKPSDPRYFAENNNPWSSVNDVNTGIPLTERHEGLTVNINNVEYWYKDSVADVDLIIKRDYTDSTIRSLISSSATGLTYNSASGDFSLTTGYSIPTTASQSNWNIAYNERTLADVTALGNSTTSSIAVYSINTTQGSGGSGDSDYNIKIGDDLFIADRDVTDAIVLYGTADDSVAGIIFGQTDLSNKLYNTGSVLKWRGNTLTDSSTTVAGFPLTGNVTLADLTAIDTTLTISGSSYNGSVARTIGLNLSNSNTWLVDQRFDANVGIGVAPSTKLHIGGLPATQNYIPLLIEGNSGFDFGMMLQRGGNPTQGLLISRGSTASSTPYTGASFIRTAGGVDQDLNLQSGVGIESTPLYGNFYTQMLGGNFIVGGNFTRNLFSVNLGLSKNFGNVSTTNGSVTVTGTGTNFLSLFKIGDIIRVGSESRTIATISSDTTLTTDSWTTTNTNQLFNVNPIIGTASVTPGSANIVGTGTNFTKIFVPGSVFVSASGENVIILSVNSDTSMTALSNFIAGTSGTYSVRGGGINRFNVANNGNVGIASALSTHSLTLGSSADGIAYYKTSDQFINYERIRQYWSGDIYNIASEFSGVGVARKIAFTGAVIIGGNTDNSYTGLDVTGTTRLNGQTTIGNLTVAGIVLNSAAGILSTTTTLANSYLVNSTISGISLGSNLADLTATDTTLSFSGTYNGSTARTIGLNLGSTNTWTAAQSFNATTILGNGSTNYITIAGSATNPSISVTGTGNADLRINTLGNGQTVFGGGGWAYATAASGKGSLLLNNGTADTPGLKFNYGNNVNISLDSFTSGTFGTLSGQFLRFIKNADESGGAVIAGVDLSGNASFLGAGFFSTGLRINQSASAGFAFDVNVASRFQGNITFTAINLVLDTTTGTKIGTATSQKLSLWNATPIVQPTTSVAAATFVSNTSLIMNDTATFDGYTIGQIVKALRNIGALA